MLKKSFAVLLCMLMIALLPLGCSKEPEEAPVLAAPSSCINAAKVLNLGYTLMPTSTASAALRAVEAGEVTYALVPWLEAEKAFAGLGEYAAPMESLSVVGDVLAQSVQLVSCIGDMAHWTNETVVIAAERGSAQAELAMLLFEAQGSSTNNVNITYAEASSAVKAFVDGRAEAIILIALPGDELVVEALERKNAALMNVPEKTALYMSQLDDSYAAYSMAGVYEGRVLPVEIAGMYATLVCREDNPALSDMAVQLVESPLYTADQPQMLLDKLEELKKPNPEESILPTEESPEEEE